MMCKLRLPHKRATGKARAQAAVARRQARHLILHLRYILFEQIQLETHVNLCGVSLALGRDGRRLAGQHFVQVPGPGVQAALEFAAGFLVVEISRA